MPRTPEQQTIIDLMADKSAGHLVVDAKAGSGKTTTLIDGLKEMQGETLVLAFNRSIADEMKLKAGRSLDFIRLSEVQISTVHSHGLKAFSKSGLRAKTLSGKVQFMLKDEVQKFFSDRDDIHRNLSKVARLVSAAKGSGFGLSSLHERFPDIDDREAWFDMAEHYNLEEELVGDTSLDQVVTLAIKMLKASNARKNSIDFDDMIYLPLLFNLQIPQYANVLIDEAQDINATRRELAFRSLKPNGRLVAVGDPNQAIYGFTGADPQSLAKITARAKARVLPLTVCWRCDGDIIKAAQKQVPTIQARPGAPSGQVLTIDFEKDNFLSMPQDGDAILCRINKPNVAACLGLLRRGVRAKIEGRDIGKRFEFHLQKANPLYATQSLDDTLLELETYKETELARMAAKDKSESAMALLEDEVDATILIVERAMENVQTDRTSGVKPLAHEEYPYFEQLLASLFGDDVKNAVVLSSVHKAKGREWKRVFILGYKDWMPHKMAKIEWEQEQEQNLIYVAKTRAEKILVYVNGAQSAIDRGLHREKPKAKEEAA